MSFLPPEQDLYALVALAADPTATKKRLYEIDQATEQMNNSIDAARVLEISSSKNRFAAEQALLKMETVRKEHQAEVEKTKKDFEEKDKSLADLKASVSTLKSQLEVKKKDLDEKEYRFNLKSSEVAGREHRVKEQEIDLSNRLVEVSKREADVNSRIARLKNALV